MTVKLAAAPFTLIILSAAFVAWTSTSAFAAVLALISVSSIIAMRKIHGNHFSPVTLFTAGWMLPATFTIFLPLHNTYHDWAVRAELWVAVLLAYLSFAIGHLIVALVRSLYTKVPNARAGSESSSSFDADVVGERAWNMLLIKCFFTLGMIGFAVNLSNVLGAGGVKLYFEAGLRSTEEVFGQSTLVNYLYFLNGLVIILGAIQQTKFGFDRSTSVLMALAFVTLPFHGIKGTIIYPTVAACLGSVYAARSIRLKYILYGLVITVMGFQFVTIGRNLPSLLLQDMDVLAVATYRIDSILLYLLPGFANLQEEIIHFARFQAGIESFQVVEGVWNALIGSSAIGDAAQGRQFHLVNDAFNVGTFLREHVRDFGYAGCIVFPLAYGALTTVLYMRMVRQPVLINIGIYAICSLMVVFSFFSNQYWRVQYWYWIGILLVLLALRWALKSYVGESGRHLKMVLADSARGEVRIHPD